MTNAYLSVDGREFTSRTAAHAALRAVLGSENYYGSNLDALHDCLTSICEKTTLRIYNWSAAVHKLGRYSDSLWRVFYDSQKENGLLDVVIE
jgi:RNAse (barnase) inhibitor barstar